MLIHHPGKFYAQLTREPQMNGRFPSRQTEIESIDLKMISVAEKT